MQHPWSPPFSFSDSIHVPLLFTIHLILPLMPVQSSGTSLTSCILQWTQLQHRWSHPSPIHSILRSKRYRIVSALFSRLLFHRCDGFDCEEAAPRRQEETPFIRARLSIRRLRFFRTNVERVGVWTRFFDANSWWKPTAKAWRMAKERIKNSRRTKNR